MRKTIPVTSALLAQEWARRAGLAVIHLLWQGALVGVLVVLSMPVTRLYRPLLVARQCFQKLLPWVGRCWAAGSVWLAPYNLAALFSRSHPTSQGACQNPDILPKSQRLQIRTTRSAPPSFAGWKRVIPQEFSLLAIVAVFGIGSTFYAMQQPGMVAAALSRLDTTKHAEMHVSSAPEPWVTPAQPMYLLNFEGSSAESAEDFIVSQLTLLRGERAEVNIVTVEAAYETLDYDARLRLLEQLSEWVDREAYQVRLQHELDTRGEFSQ